MTTTWRWRTWRDPRFRGLYLLDLAVALGLSTLAVLSILGVTHGGVPQGGALAATGVLAMTLPVAWRRQAPIAAAGALAAGALLNGMLFGHLVRCGTALPAVFLVAYAVGARSTRTRAAVGLGLCAVNVMAQAWWDPQLGLTTLVYLLPILGGFFALGILVRSRTLAAQALQRQSSLLRARRDETARTSIAADQAQLADDLDRGLRDHSTRSSRQPKPVSRACRSTLKMPAPGCHRSSERHARHSGGCVSWWVHSPSYHQPKLNPPLPIFRHCWPALRRPTRVWPSTVNPGCCRRGSPCPDTESSSISLP